jgi:hypothetical protein
MLRTHFAISARSSRSGFADTWLTTLRNMSEGSVRQESVHAENAGIHQLGYVQIDYQTGEGDGVHLVQAILLAHKRHHGIEGDHGGFVQVFVDSQSDPARGCLGPRRFQVTWVLQLKAQHDPFHRALNSGAADFSVGLNGVAVSDGEECERDWYG